MFRVGKTHESKARFCSRFCFLDVYKIFTIFMLNMSEGENVKLDIAFENETALLNGNTAEMDSAVPCVETDEPVKQLPQTKSDQMVMIKCGKKTRLRSPMPQNPKDECCLLL